jgi:DNA-binding LacI/PurR family transcriptional regulator
MVSPPTAVFIADPLTAAGAVNEAHKMGLRIPDELSILGFDDTDARFMVFPMMTAICQDSRELGRQAFEQAARLSSKLPGGPMTTTVGTAWLEINHTTGRAPSIPTRVLPSGQRLEATQITHNLPKVVDNLLARQ